MAKKSTSALVTPPEEAKGTASRQKPSSLLDTRVIYCGDNLEQLPKLPDACIDLIYIDPPFNSNRNYEVFWGETKEKRAFDDRHESTKAYIDYMRPRCVQLARVLKKTGTFYYHCDWHASHYVKVMLDQIFGENNFCNEIIWRRTTAKTQSYNLFPNNHDSLFFYGGGGERTFHRQFTPLSEERIAKHYGHVDEKTGRRYSLSDLTGEGIRKGETGKVWRGGLIQLVSNATGHNRLQNWINSMRKEGSIGLKVKEAGPGSSVTSIRKRGC